MATSARSIAPDARYATLFGRALPRLPGARHGAIRRRREASFDRFLALLFLKHGHSFQIRG